jgi:CheY-like chemotaxis protein/glycine cleavage system H lipoate-binding protein
MSDPAKVLVVDDEQVVLDSVERHLRRDGYAILKALSAADALGILAGEGADVVITDLMMPEMDGLGFLARIREEGLTMPVIMITGYATMRTALQALRNGAFDYIAKPFTRTELLGTVARAARRAVLPDSGGTPGAGAPTGAVACGPCWVSPQLDGSARLGLSEEFAATAGEPDSLDLPGAGDFLEQGSAALKLLSKDGRTHVLWTPVSGNVIEVNPALAADPSLAVRDPGGEGWLLRLDAPNLKAELAALAPD